ncbi:alanine--tRNA ligase [Zavarzinia aquatilis]|uniref:Alanine--tRNA ligase n=1 Tax=Zavarzinia aquatilis TaxID=2211142 RepID=A0A317E2S2_9PROT|nr:alanine--tRNA ligase [Zavarzinia aquatilis]PWR21299.1 alanine--tRNA ligase [Zavarzinia aquatilis]
MKSINEIRSTFIDYFVKAGHRPVASSPLVPANDPTLMFTNAGMVQFKDIFTGKERRDYVRATTSQKCVRAGGKHNDLDNVGYTARHHTFFEMLGNFSFGDYFKETAIELAWNLITRDFGLPKDKLWVTVYHDDDEAFSFWKKIAGLPDERIVRIATSDNFWAMGDTGPCGPCSEIFFDHGPGVAGGPPGSPDADGDRYIEIWNLVFMQYEQSADGTRVALPKPSIDTGMGLERVSAVLQGVHNNYETDLFKALIAASADATNTDPNGPMIASHRVIADHLRASSFLMADGVMPSNEGRGNVLRRIMRRAMRHAQLLGAKDPLMYRLVPALIKQMGVAYPELIRAEALITETLKLEETRFKQTLERGLKLLDDEVEKLGAGQPLPGDVAFKLYDTYGFPLDLTQDALRAKDIAVDTDGFNTAMAHQKTEARKAWAGSGEAATDLVWYELKEEVGATEFLGYETETAEAKIAGLVVDGKRVASAGPGTAVAIVVNQTPFYGESGGQMGDTGVIRGPGYSVAVTDTAKKLGLHIHLGTVEGGTIKVGDDIHLSVDNGRRSRLRANHSATHLLHKALRDVLGPHVTQKGSMVAEERLRFDISHPKALSDEEIDAVEIGVNAAIRENGGVTTRLMTPDDAIKAGALALFGEKYGEEVRVVSMGGADLDHAYSTELCGGTHVFRTGDIAVFKIVSESAVSAGVRRIEALTGAAALKYMRDEEILLKKAASALKASPAELPDRVASLLDERKRLERELAEAKKQLATGGGSGGGLTAIDVGGIKVIAKKLDGVNPKDLRGLVDETKKQLGSGIVAFVGVNDGKAALVVGVTEDLVAKHSAVDLIRVGVEAVGGKGGGGRPDLAQAGGPDGDKADAALEAMVKAIGG